MWRIIDCCEPMLENLQSPDDGITFDEECGPVITHKGEHVVSIGYCPWCGRHIEVRKVDEEEEE